LFDLGNRRPGEVNMRSVYSRYSETRIPEVT